MTTLILASHDGRQLDPATPRLVAAAQQLGQPARLLLLGHGLDAVAPQAAALPGVAQVLCIDDAALAQPSAETLARQLVAVMQAGSHRTLLAAHTLQARAALPRAAAQLQAAFLADVSAIPAPDRVVRALYAGSAMATLQLPSIHAAESAASQVLMTLRVAAFEPAPGAADSAVRPCPIASLRAVAADPRTRLLGRELAPASADRPDLGRARVVVAGGRGVGAAEPMRLVEALADRLGGAVGASRAAVDAGFAPNALQIGQTGKSVAPEVYIAAGISGAIQHLAGIKDAKLIVAINQDPDAPIFSVADIGLAADLFEVLPALTAALPDLRDRRVVA